MVKISAWFSNRFPGHDNYMKKIRLVFCLSILCIQSCFLQPEIYFADAVLVPLKVNNKWVYEIRTHEGILADTCTSSIIQQSQVKYEGEILTAFEQKSCSSSVTVASTEYKRNEKDGFYSFGLKGGNPVKNRYAKFPVKDGEEYFNSPGDRSKTTGNYMEITFDEKTYQCVKYFVASDGFHYYEQVYCPGLGYYGIFIPYPGKNFWLKKLISVELH